MQQQEQFGRGLLQREGLYKHWWMMQRLLEFNHELALRYVYLPPSAEELLKRFQQMEAVSKEEHETRMAFLLSRQCSDGDVGLAAPDANVPTAGISPLDTDGERR